MSRIRKINAGAWSNLANNVVRKIQAGSWTPTDAYRGVSFIGENGGGTWNSGAVGYALSSVTGSQAGDLSIIVCTNRFNVVVDVPSGYTLQESYNAGGGIVIDVMYKRLTGLETWPITITSNINNGYGWIAHQTVLRGAASASPVSTAFKNGGYKSRIVSTGRIAPTQARSYMLHTIASDTSSTVSTYGTKILHNENINVAYTMLGKRLPNTASCAYNVRFADLLQGINTMTFIINPDVTLF